MTDANQHLKHERTPSKFELLLDFFKTRLLTIIFLLALAALAFAFFGINIEVPRWLKLAFVTFVILAPYGYIVGKYVVSLLWNPQSIFVVDLDARYLDGALYEFPAASFRDLQTTDGEMCQLTPHLYTAKNVDLDALEAVGTWRGTASDPALLRSLKRVDEVRGDLEDDARRGFAIETQAWTIIRSATREATLRVVKTFERGTLPDEGASIDRAIESALDEFDLDERIRRTDDDLDNEDLEAVEPNEFDPEDRLDEFAEVALDERLQDVEPMEANDD